MKTRLNVSEVLNRINIPSLQQEIVTRSERGEFKPQSPISTLLDPFKDSLLKARQTGATFAALTKFFRNHQVPISEAALRKYLHQHGDKRQPRQKRKPAGLKGAADPNSGTLSETSSPGQWPPQSSVSRLNLGVNRQPS